MSKLTFKFESSAFDKAKAVIAQEYNRITVRSYDVKATKTKSSQSTPKMAVKSK